MANTNRPESNAWAVDINPAKRACDPPGETARRLEPLCAGGGSVKVTVANDPDRHLSNRLLAALPLDGFARLRPHLSTVRLRRGEVLTDAGEPIRDAYFPHAGVVSLVSVMGDGRIAETGTIGSEGFTGFWALLGSDVAICRSMVQVEGEASRIGIEHLRAAVRASEEIRDVMLGYVWVLLVQLAQSVACNSLHSVEERAARWLLMAHDRAGHDTFGMTQEFIAEMLGVRRPTVSVVARSLQHAGLIRYRRGSITITDRAALEGAACECYAVVRRAFNFEPHLRTGH